MRRLLLSLILMLPGLVGWTAGSRQGFVNDFMPTDNPAFSPIQREALQKKLAAFAKDTQIEVVLAVVPLSDAAALSAEVDALYKRWRIGRKYANGGLLVVAAPAVKVVRASRQSFIDARIVVHSMEGFPGFTQVETAAILNGMPVGLAFVTWVDELRNSFVKLSSSTPSQPAVPPPRASISESARPESTAAPVVRVPTGPSPAPPSSVAKAPAPVGSASLAPITERQRSAGDPKVSDRATPFFSSRPFSSLAGAGLIFIAVFLIIRFARSRLVKREIDAAEDPFTDGQTAASASASDAYVGGLLDGDMLDDQWYHEEQGHQLAEHNCGEMNDTDRDMPVAGDIEPEWAKAKVVLCESLEAEILDLERQQEAERFAQAAARNTASIPKCNG